jgi:hypothetical protein
MAGCGRLAQRPHVNNRSCCCRHLILAAAALLQQQFQLNNKTVLILGAHLQPQPPPVCIVSLRGQRVVFRAKSSVSQRAHLRSKEFTMIRMNKDGGVLTSSGASVDMRKKGGWRGSALAAAHAQEKNRLQGGRESTRSGRKQEQEPTRWVGGTVYGGLKQKRWS